MSNDDVASGAELGRCEQSGGVSLSDLMAFSSSSSTSSSATTELAMATEDNQLVAEQYSQISRSSSATSLESFAILEAEPEQPELILASSPFVDLDRQVSADTDGDRCTSIMSNSDSEAIGCSSTSDTSFVPSELTESEGYDAQTSAMSASFVTESDVTHSLANDNEPQHQVAPRAIQDMQNLIYKLFIGSAVVLVVSVLIGFGVHSGSEVQSDKIGVSKKLALCQAELATKQNEVDQLRLLHDETLQQAEALSDAADDDGTESESESEDEDEDEGQLNVPDQSDDYYWRMGRYRELQRGRRLLQDARLPAWHVMRMRRAVQSHVENPPPKAADRKKLADEQLLRTDSWVRRCKNCKKAATSTSKGQAKRNAKGHARR